MMKRTLAAVMLSAMIVFPSAGVLAGDAQTQKKDEKVKVSAKDLAEIKRQMRLMREEMGALEEKIDEITALHDRVYTDVVPSTEPPAAESSHTD